MARASNRKSRRTAAIVVVAAILILIAGAGGWWILGDGLGGEGLAGIDRTGQGAGDAAAKGSETDSTDGRSGAGGNASKGAAPGKGSGQGAGRRDVGHGHDGDAGGDSGDSTYPGNGGAKSGADGEEDATGDADASKAIDPLALHELQFRIPLGSEERPMPFLTEEFVSSVPERLVWMLCLHDSGGPLPGWRLVEDRWRSLDENGVKIDPSPDPRVDIGLYERREGEKGLASRFELMPLYWQSFGAMANVLEDPSMVLAYPMELVMEQDRPLLRVSLPWVLVGTHAFSLNDQVSKYAASYIKLNRGVWKLRVFGMRDVPPNELALGQPVLSQVEKDTARADFPPLSTTMNIFTGGQYSEFRGQFRHHASGKKAALAASFHLWVMDPAEVCAPQPPNSGHVVVVNHRFLWSQSCTALPHGGFGGMVCHVGTVGNGVSDSLEITESEHSVPVWWPELSHTFGGVLQGVFALSTDSLVPARHRASHVPEMRELLEKAKSGTYRVPSPVPLFSQKVFGEWTEIREGPPEVIPAVADGDPETDCDEAFLVLPFPVLRGGILDFGDVMLGGTLLEVSFELPEEPIIPVDAMDKPVHVGVLVGRRPQELVSPYKRPTEVRCLGTLRGGARLVAPGQVTGADAWVDYIGDHEEGLRAWLPERTYGAARWQVTAWPAPESARIVLPLQVSAQREVTVTPMPESEVSRQEIHVYLDRAGPSSVVAPNWVSNGWQSHFSRENLVCVSPLDGAGKAVISVPTAKNGVVGYWVVADIIGMPVTAEYCQMKDKGPLTIRIAQRQRLLVNVAAPDINWLTDDVRNAQVGEAAEAAGWSGEYVVMVTADRVRDGVRLAKAIKSVMVGSTVDFVLEAATDDPLRIRVTADGRSHDLGKYRPELDTIVNVSGRPAVEPGDDQPPDATATIAFPTRFERWLRSLPEGVSPPPPYRGESGGTFLANCGGHTVFFDAMAINQFGDAALLSEMASPWAEGSSYPESVGHPVAILAGSTRIPLRRVSTLTADGKPAFRITAELPETVRLSVKYPEGVTGRSGVIVLKSGKFKCTVALPESSSVVGLFAPPGPALAIERSDMVGVRGSVRFDVPTSGVARAVLDLGREQEGSSFGKELE